MKRVTKMYFLMSFGAAAGLTAVFVQVVENILLIGVNDDEIRGQSHSGKKNFAKMTDILMTNLLVGIVTLHDSFRGSALSALTIT